MVNRKVIFLLITLILASFFLTIKVDAETGWGGGRPPSEGGVGNWPYQAGAKWDGVNNTEAWNIFYNKHKNKQFPGGKTMEEYINSMSNSYGFTNPDGSKLSLLDSCKRSQAIWWYGETSDGRWYLEAGINNTYPPTGMGSNIQKMWDTFLKLPTDQTKWGKRPGPVLVCSGSFVPPEDDKKPITLKANSGKFMYDGTLHTVTGWKMTEGVLLKTHSVDAEATGSRMNVGISNVNFTHAKVVANGKDVSDRYSKINLIPGALEVIDKPGEPEESESKRCVYTGSDSLSAITQNNMSVNPFIDPSGLLSQMNVERLSDAYDLMTSPPSVGDEKSSWYSWKGQIIPVSKDKVIDLDITTIYKGGSSVSTIFSKYGGILDVALTHDKHKYDATFCQPQERDWIEGIDEDGDYYGYWGPWYDVGPEIIESITDMTPITPELGSYQILGMNCNDPTYRDAKASVQVGSSKEITDSQGRIISGTFKTVLKEGHAFTLGRGGPGSSMTDYTSGPTCQDNGLCTVQTGGSGNDSDQNKVELPLFTDYDNGEFNPTDKADASGILTYFRDYEERVVRADVWHLKDSSSGFISSSSDPASETPVKIYNGGTPEYSITVIKPDGEDDSNKLPDGEVVTDLGGHVNKFVFKSQWASLENKPYKLGANWIYKVDLERTTVDEITNEDVTNNEDITYEVEVACPFQSSNTSDRNGTINPDPFSKPSLNRSLLEWNIEESMKVIFSRGVSDKRE